MVLRFLWCWFGVFFLKRFVGRFWCVGVSEGVGCVRGSATVSKGSRLDLLRGSCILVMKNRQKNPDERTGGRYIIEILMSRTQKLKGLVAASLRLKTLNYNPYLKFQSI